MKYFGEVYPYSDCVLDSYSSHETVMFKWFLAKFKVIYLRPKAIFIGKSDGQGALCFTNTSCLCVQCDEYSSQGHYTSTLINFVKHCRPMVCTLESLNTQNRTID